MNKWQAYAALIRLDKPIGTLLLLWPTLTALLIATDGHPTAKLVFIFVLGTFLVRSAGCIFNDIADRDFDRYVSRTKARPMTTKRVTVKEGIILAGFILLAALILVLLTNVKTIAMAVIALVLTMFYPFMKRYTHLPQVWLGATFNIGVLMAFTAASNQWPSALAWLMYVAFLCMTVAYDTMYGMVDRDDDVKIGIKSTAILFGTYDRLATGVFQLIALLCLFAVGFWAGLNAWYYLGLLAACLFVAYEQWLIRFREPSKCFQAFLNHNYLLLAIFLGCLLAYLPPA